LSTKKFCFIELYLKGQILFRLEEKDKGRILNIRLEIGDGMIKDRGSGSGAMEFRIRPPASPSCRLYEPEAIGEL
jgi:hypothetical protein